MNYLDRNGLEYLWNKIKANSVIETDSATALKGKIFNCLGDSFTEPSDSWCKQLANRTGCTCNNYGVISSRVSEDSSEGVSSFLNRYSSMSSSADAIIIFGGINDANDISNSSNPLVLGNMGSSLNTSTFYGALRLLIENIKTAFSGKQIFGIIPPDFEPTAVYTTTLPQVQEACREIYEYYGIPYADLKKKCQEMFEDTYNNATYRESDYHPSTKGHIAISKVIQGVLEQYIHTSTASSGSETGGETTNLLDFSNASFPYTENGFTVNYDSSSGNIKLSGTVTDWGANIAIPINLTLDAGTYKLSFPQEFTDHNIWISLDNEESMKLNGLGTNSTIFTVTETTTCSELIIYTDSGVTYNDVELTISLEKTS